MLESEIIKYIKSPGLIKQANISALKELVNQFPFYQTAHIILLKALKDQGSNEFETQLEESSIFISNRNLLFNFLNQEFIVENDTISPKKSEKETEKESVGNKEIAKKLLKNQNVKRKINDSFEGMGENISETISSQLEFSRIKDDDKLEYPSEIYFIEEERNGNNIITINAEPDNQIENKKDILLIDETDQNIEHHKSNTNDESFELIEIEKSEEEKEQVKNNQGNHFDITKYADEDTLSEGDDLISSFIKKQPQIKPAETNEENIDISTGSIQEDSDLLSETLIKVYIKQGLFEKAIESYEKLSLKYPEKNVYFASQIEILQDKINKQ